MLFISLDNLTRYSIGISILMKKQVFRKLLNGRFYRPITHIENQTYQTISLHSQSLNVFEKTLRVLGMKTFFKHLKNQNLHFQYFPKKILQK